MVRLRKKPIKKTTPPDQEIPEGIEKGVEVLYMLQRVDYHYCKLVDLVVTNNSRQYERHMLDNYGEEIVMSKDLDHPGVFGRMQVKFGRSTNLKQRLDDINDNIFGAGKTEWRKVSWIVYIFAGARFWWYRWRKVVVIVVSAIISLFILILHLIATQQ